LRRPSWATKTYRFLAVVGEAAEGDVVAAPSGVGIEGVEIGSLMGKTRAVTVHQESSAGLPAPAGDEVNSRGEMVLQAKGTADCEETIGDVVG
jgi:hypothetical protein